MIMKPELDVISVLVLCSSHCTTVASWFSRAGLYLGAPGHSGKQDMQAKRRIRLWGLRCLYFLGTLRRSMHPPKVRLNFLI